MEPEGTRAPAVLRVTSIVGTRLDPSFHERLHQLEHRSAVDTVQIETADLPRRRFRATSERGRVVEISLPRDQSLFDGAVLWMSDAGALVLRVAAQRWLRLAPHTRDDALALGYYAGNLHWRVQFDGAALLVALEAPVEDYLVRLGDLASSGRLTHTVIDRHAMLNVLSALQQADTAFPSGGFAFSNGIEGLSATGVGLDGPALTGVLGGVLRHRWALCDRVALVRAWRAGPVPERLAAIDHAMEAATLPESLRRGSCRNGAALLAAHVRLQTPGAAALQHALDAGSLLGHLAVLQGALWRNAGLDEAVATQVSGYTVVSGLASAAVRLGSLGALAAQAAVRDVLPLLAELCLVEIDDAAVLSGALPWLDIACARQQGAALRLFAN